MSLPVFEDFVLIYHNHERKTEAVELSHPTPNSFVFHYTDCDDFMFGNHRFWYDNQLSDALSQDIGVPTCVVKRKRDKTDGSITWYVVQQDEVGFSVIALTQGETIIDYEYSELRRREGWNFLIKKSLRGSFHALREAYFAHLFDTPAYRLLAVTNEIKVVELT